MDSLQNQVAPAAEEAVLAGDIRRLDALAQAFPFTFERLKDSNLLDIALQSGQTSVAIFLILRHGFEVSPEFNKQEKEFTGDLFADGANEYQQTLECLAELVIEEKSTELLARGAACYKVRNLVRDITSTNWPRNPPQGSIALFHPDFIRAISDGTLKEFLRRKIIDDRFSQCGDRHFIAMLKKLDESMEDLKPIATAYLAAHGQAPASSDGPVNAMAPRF